MRKDVFLNKYVKRKFCLYLLFKNIEDTILNFKNYSRVHTKTTLSSEENVSIPSDLIIGIVLITDSQSLSVGVISNFSSTYYIQWITNQQSCSLSNNKICVKNIYSRVLFIFNTV